MKQQHLHESQIGQDILDDIGYQSNLVVHNDEVNTFDWVIASLVDVCKHTFEQAEQCALLIHFRGKYPVKMGDKDILKPMKNSLIDRGINASIQEFK